MAASVRIWEAANLFVGDNGPNNSKHLSLVNITLPSMKEASEEHKAGGAIGSLNIGFNFLEALEVKFKLVGSDPQAKVQFGIGAQATKPYTIYGGIRDKNGGRLIERKVIVHGRMLEMIEDEFERAKLLNQDHTISEIIHMEWYEDGAEIYYYDWFNTVFRVNGVDQRQDLRAILRI